MTQSDVLIIGAGPSGLFAAAELARHGVRARIVERQVEPHREARATAIQPGTLEILESIGLLQPFLEASEHVRCSRLYGPAMSVLGATKYDGLACRCPFQCSLPQYETERILVEHLTRLGVVVERGVMANPLTPVGVTSSCRSPLTPDPSPGGRGETGSPLVLRGETDPLSIDLIHADGRVESLRPRFVIGAGGAHSVTRHSMGQPLEGATYQGHFLVADIAMPAPFPRDESGVICGPDGFLLLGPLPGGRWISFQDLEEHVETVTAQEVVARVQARLGQKYRPTDVAWFAPFRMHRRIVARLADGRRFLIGDAAHLSSPFGGEGLNGGLHDGYDLAWKLALVSRGQGRVSLLDGYQAERMIADRHILDISDQIHRTIVDIAATVRQGREVPVATVDPAVAAMQCNARTMLDIDYAGSPLVVDYAGNGESTDKNVCATEGHVCATEDKNVCVTVGPHPGQPYPDWTRLGGTSHHVLIFGPVADTASLARLGQRWSRVVKVSHDHGLNSVRAGLPGGGLVMIRPDGHIGFRFPAADAKAIAALDRHLDSYLIPGPV